MSKILVITDVDFKSSGYFNLSMPICQGLQRKGHDVKVAGLNYKGEEHYWDFSIIPAENMREVQAMVTNFQLEGLGWNFDILLVAMDLSIHERLLPQYQSRNFKYYGIFPIEADPLSMKWAMTIMQMDKAFCISEFGTEEAKKRGISNVQHLVVGIDTEIWREPKEGEKEKFRKAYGIKDGTFVVLSVSDNQERKNWYSNCSAFQKLVKHDGNCLHIIVTRQNFFAGWDLDELTLNMGTRNKTKLLDRGMPIEELWKLYALSDCYLMLSKAEGLGMTTIEAMATGLPVLSTNCTANVEHLKDGRGFLIDYMVDENHDFPPIDPFGIAHRYWANSTMASNIMLGLKEGRYRHNKGAALEYINSRTWDKAVDMIDKEI